MGKGKQTPFAGLKAGSNTAMPEWYRERHGVPVDEDLPSLREVVDGLESVTDVVAGYKDPETDEWIEVPRRRAVVNPEWLGAGLEEVNRGDALWQFASDQYTPVPPEDMWGPLANVASRMDLNVFGVVTEHRHGGEVHADLVLPDFRFDVGEDTYVLTYESGFSHYGDQSLYYTVGAVNERTGSMYRGMTDKETCPHRGRATDKVAAWWEDGLSNAEQATSTLGSVMREAMRYVVPFEGMPYNVVGFMEGLKWPDALAEAAAEHVKSVNTGGAEPDEATALALYEGMAAAMTNEYQGKTGGYHLKRLNKRANKVLFSPPSAEATVINYWQTQLAEQETLDMEERQHRTALGERYGDTQAAVEHYQDTKEQLKEILKEAGA